MPNPWGAATPSGGRLLGRQELIGQLQQAGFQNAEKKRLIPDEELSAFKAITGENA